MPTACNLNQLVLRLGKAVQATVVQEKANQIELRYGSGCSGCLLQQQPQATLLQPTPRVGNAGHLVNLRMNQTKSSYTECSNTMRVSTRRPTHNLF